MEKRVFPDGIRGNLEFSYRGHSLMHLHGQKPLGNWHESIETVPAELDSVSRVGNSVKDSMHRPGLDTCGN